MISRRRTTCEACDRFAGGVEPTCAVSGVALVPRWIDPDATCPLGHWPEPSALDRVRAIWAEPSAGLGDTVAKMTKTIGIKPCGGCEERRKKLNELMPYNKEQ